MRLYTRTGDDGTTGLFGGERVGKDDPRIEAVGAVDELNACLGLAVAACDEERPLPARLSLILSGLQSRLFDLGADLATPESSKHEAKIARISAAHAREVEGWIDEIDGGNAPLERFVLPGGTDLAARLHLARAVCRRAERAMVALGRGRPVNPEAIRLVNRVSDLLFACARRANLDADVPDRPWEAGSGR